MRAVICDFDSAGGSNLIRANVLDQTLLYSIGQRAMPKVRSASSTELNMSRTITLHLQMGQLRTPVTFEKVASWPYPSYWAWALSTVFYQPGRKKHFPPELSAGTRPDGTRAQQCSLEEYVGYPPIYHTESALLVTSTSWEPKYIRVALQIDLEEMRERPVLFFTKEAS